MGDPRVFAKVGKTFEADNIIWLGKIDDNALAALLRDSLCLCFPSLTEGFGLPALEAMAIGCPVIATDRASLPEVCGDAALYASPVEPSTWLQRISELRNTPGLAHRLIDRGHDRAQLFSWRAAAEAYLELMARADCVQSEMTTAAVSDQAIPLA
jgi:glycosyltransferase involved in cell wall biosynthesis